jgi:hypothetical protein
MAHDRPVIDYTTMIQSQSFCKLFYLSFLYTYETYGSEFDAEFFIVSHVLWRNVDNG